MAFSAYPGATTGGTRYIIGTTETSSTQGEDEKSPCPCGGGQKYALDASPLPKTGKAADMPEWWVWLRACGCVRSCERVTGKG